MMIPVIVQYHALACGLGQSTRGSLGSRIAPKKRLTTPWQLRGGQIRKPWTSSFTPEPWLSFPFPAKGSERESTRGNLGTELGHPFRRAWGELHLGWFHSLDRDRPECIARMQRALADCRTAGLEILMSWFLSRIAQVQSRVGHNEEALVAIEQALVVVEETGERAYEAEVYRMKGEVLLAKDRSNAMQAEQSFCTAIEIARAIAARQNRRNEARSMFAEIYNWFTEGFETADLKDAKALLEELSNSL